MLFISFVSTKFHVLKNKTCECSRYSPDSFVQMAILLSYYSLYGKVVCQYEPVLMKRFLHGRTEAMRSAIPNAALLCETWCSDSASNEQKISALRAATNEHSCIVKECASGKGVERHLFALKCISERHNLPLPSFFNSNAWKTLNHTILSTSNCGNPSLRHFGFGPVVPDGFGIGYIIKDQTLHFSISSRSRQTDRYRNTLLFVLCQVESMLKPTMKVEVLSNAMSSRVNSEVLFADGYDEYQDIPESPTNYTPGELAKRRSSFLIASVKLRPTLAREELESVGVGLSPATIMESDTI